MTTLLQFLLPLAGIIGNVDSVRHCFGCSGHQCLQNPADPTLFPGRVRCHDVMEYCTTHIRYLVNNASLDSGRGLSPLDYQVQSVTRGCAKVWLGNLCRRDWLGRPHITCISTCDSDLCNCASRSPPLEMFRNGTVLPESPKRSTYRDTDLLSCRAMAGVPGYGGDRIPVDDYEYYNQKAWEEREKRRQLRRRIHNGSVIWKLHKFWLILILIISYNKYPFLQFIFTEDIW